ncbi:MAG: PH domain-containing protein [Actinomycetota bacterium]|nr:PH domain-containing protein [Actinomycetota bacterium]
MWWTAWGTVVLVGTFVASPTISELPFGGAAFTAASVLAVVVSATVPYLRYRRWRYEVRERDLFLSRGSWFYVLTLIPFDRIQYVETQQGPLDLAFGLMQLVVYTAAGKAARIPGLAPDEAEALREELSKVAGTESV